MACLYGVIRQTPPGDKSGTLAQAVSFGAKGQRVKGGAWHC